MVDYRWGVPLDERTADMLDEVRRLCPLVPLSLSQGCYNAGGVAASAGTHDGAGAFDARAVELTPAQRDELVTAMRRVGFAAWLRTPAQSDWPYHIHGIAVGPGGKDDRWELSRGAHDQVIDYFENRNGLASNLPDDGPTREYVGVTWESYKSSPSQPGGDDFMWSVILINHKGKRYASYPTSGVKVHIDNPQQEQHIKSITAKAGGKVIEWSAGKDVDDPGAFGQTIG
jgi:hypothetical protein